MFKPYLCHEVSKVHDGPVCLLGAVRYVLYDRSLEPGSRLSGGKRVPLRR